MLATEKSLGKDPRDKVFGVLALAQANVRHQYSIRADYSLSLQHIMIGAFSQRLVVDKDPGSFGWHVVFKAGTIILHEGYSA